MASCNRSSREKTIWLFLVHLPCYSLFDSSLPYSSLLVIYFSCRRSVMYYVSPWKETILYLWSLLHSLCAFSLLIFFWEWRIYELGTPSALSAAQLFPLFFYPIPFLTTPNSLFASLTLTAHSTGIFTELSKITLRSFVITNSYFIALHCICEIKAVLKSTPLCFYQQ